MSNMSGRGNLTAILSLLTIGAALFLGVARAADDVTEDEIVGALAPAQKPLTRGLSVGPQTQTDPATAAAEGRFVQTIRDRPTRSLSATEREKIATQDLSERRADSIKRHLVDKFGMAGTDLVTVGYGKSKLKEPSNPMAEVNRRVQVVNMANKATASK
jgi:hypothetical protein